jgi:type I restriction enzyme M protein
MKIWTEIVEHKLKKQKNSIAKINLEKVTVSYSEKVKLNRVLKTLTGDEEIVRAFLIDRLVNELDYKPENIEIEKAYNITGGRQSLTPRIDVLIKDEKGNPFFFIEAKAPDKYEADKDKIEGQLFSLAQAEEKDFKTKVKYLVYYTSELVEEQIVDKSIIIDFEKYPTYAEWEADGFISIGSELTAGYGEPKKQPLIKGNDKYDLRTKINRAEIENLGRNLHNVLWGGGGTNDSEIFYSLVNIILAKLQDEYDKDYGEEYDFQIYQYGNSIENQEKIFNRINKLGSTTN